MRAELAALRHVRPQMIAFAPNPSRSASLSPWRVRPALLAALALSVVLHVVWSLWPVDFAAAPEEPPLPATLTVMPPPPVAPPHPPPQPTAEPGPVSKPILRSVRPHRAVIAVPTPAAPEVPTAPVAVSPALAPNAPAVTAASDSPPDAATGAPEMPPVVLPPRVDLAYKVFLGTQGFMIGDATYRFEHTGDDYRISTVGHARGLAAIFIHGRGKVESRGRITPNGLQPYEFAIERGSADRRETAYFDWDARSVVLNDGSLMPLEAPAFDPLTVLWQPYFAPPSREDQTFSVATTRRVARYTLALEGEETLPWRDGEIATQRWHEKSSDGKTEAWFWLAPSMHYIPVRMRVARTSRGTLEARLDAIRGDTSGDGSTDAVQGVTDDDNPFKPWNPMSTTPGPDSHGQ